jgi:hypothetical protein
MKKRFLYTLFSVLVIPIGLYIRRHKGNFPYLIGEFAPDTLWALLLFWVFSIVLFRYSSLRIFWIVLIFTYLIEVSQFYQGAWLTALRQTFLGAMLLGHTFLWTDLVCYTVGIGIGYLVDVNYFEKKINC